MSTNTNVEYMDIAEVRRTTCDECGVVKDDGHYVWCPNCGSNRVRHY